MFTISFPLCYISALYFLFRRGKIYFINIISGGLNRFGNILQISIIRLRDRQRVVQDRLIDIADVAGEDDLLFASALAQPELDAGRAKQVADVGKPHPQPVCDRDDLAIPAGSEQG